MLVLSRKVGERIVIAEEVIVTVLEVSANQVKLGIEAPRSINVLRAELAEGTHRATPRSTFKRRGANRRPLSPMSPR
jgi:carbon storage regulator